MSAFRMRVPVLAFAALGLFGCARDPATPPKPVSRGEAIYRERCGRCHDLVPPAAYSPAQWASVLGRMQPYAELNDEELGAIASWIASAP